MLCRPERSAIVRAFRLAYPDCTYDQVERAHTRLTRHTHTHTHSFTHTLTHSLTCVDVRMLSRIEAHTCVSTMHIHFY